MSSNFDKQLEKILKGDVDKLVDDLPEGEEEEEKEPEEMLPVEYERRETSLELSNKDFQEDYEYARSNLYGLIGKSNAALELTLKIALMSEHPRALEVAANLIKTSSDISKELMGIHKQLNDSNKGGGGSEPSGKYVQNNFYGESKETTERIIDDLPDDEEESKDEK